METTVLYSLFLWATKPGGAGLAWSLVWNKQAACLGTWQCPNLDQIQEAEPLLAWSWAPGVPQPLNTAGCALPVVPSGQLSGGTVRLCAGAPVQHSLPPLPLCSVLLSVALLLTPECHAPIPPGWLRAVLGVWWQRSGGPSVGAFSWCQAAGSQLPAAP